MAATSNVSIRLDTELVDDGGTGGLKHLTLRQRSSREAKRLPASRLFILIGADRTLGMDEEEPRGHALVTAAPCGAELVR